MSGGWDGIGLAPELVEAVTDLGWQFPVDVQDEAIPLFLGGGDVMVAAATGSGKTGAFGLPIVQTILEQRRYESRPAPKVDYDSFDAAGSVAAAAAPMTLSRADVDSIVQVTDDGLGCRTEHPKFWGGVRATKSVKGGKYYFEVTVVRGLCRVGFSTANATLDLGTDAGGFGYGGTAMKSNMKRFDAYGEKYVALRCVAFAFAYVLACARRTLRACRSSHSSGGVHSFIREE
jgi:ATP-dependent RNA helicase DDX1